VSIRPSAGQPSIRIRSSNGSAVTAARTAGAARGRCGEVAGASGGHDVTRGLDDVSDDACRVRHSRLLKV